MRADILINATEAGTIVTISFNGSLSTNTAPTGTTNQGSKFINFGPVNDAISWGSGLDFTDRYFPNLTGWSGTDFSSANVNALGNSFSGTNFGLSKDGAIFLPGGYIDGTVLSGSMTFNGQSLASLGLDPNTQIVINTNFGRIIFFQKFELDQLFYSAIPMNQAIGQIASSIHTTGTRDFSSRLFRLRNRYEPGDGVAQSDNDSFQRHGREVSASRFVRMQRQLEMDTTINLGGTNYNSPNRSGEDLDAPVIQDQASLLSVTREAGSRIDPSILACGDNWVVFGSADFGSIELDSLGGNPAVDSDTQAASLGIEYQINENLAFGGGWSHLWNDTEFGANAGGVEIEGDVGVIYASYFQNNLWGDLMYSYGHYAADISRNTGAGTTVRAAPDINTHQAALNLGYNVGHCGGNLVHDPTLAATYTTGTLDGYTETGDPLRNTTFADQDFESFITTLGWQVNWKKESCFGMMRPQLRAGYSRENLDQNQRIQAIVPQLGGQVFTQNNLDPGEGWLDLGAGMAIDLGKNVSLIMDYNGQFLRENAQVHYGSVRAKLAF